MKGLLSRAVFRVLILVMLIWAGLSAFRMEPGLHQDFIHKTKTFFDAINAFTNEAKTGNASHLQEKYRELREQYKQMELYIIYFTDVSEKAINGALIPEVEFDDPLQQVVPPQGLQVLEELLWADTLDRVLLVKEAERIQGTAYKLKQISLTQEMMDWQVFEAAQSELLRIMALGLNNFDSPYQGNCLEESSYALQGIQEAIAPWMDDLKRENSSLKKALDKQFSKSIKTLRKCKAPEKFDRLSFIREDLGTLYSSFKEIQKVLKIEGIGLPSPIKEESNTPFDLNAFNIDFFKSDYSEYQDKHEKLLELGRLLFFDPVLSGNGERSCASCHNPEKAFSDGKIKSTAFNFEGEVPRNAPGLTNVGFQRGFFLDIRVMQLEEQVRDVTHNQKELHGDLEKAAKLLQDSPEYRKRFAEIFAGTQHEQIDAYAIRKAIAEYERSLIALNSPFDQYLRKEKKEIDAAVKNGFNLFMGKAQCGTCHFFPLFNGTVPPHYTKTEWEVIGVPVTANLDSTHLDPDPGRGGIFQVNIHQFAFKTPGIRNIALTGPYMHNGVFKTLDEVMEFYNRGGGQGIGIGPKHQTLPSEKLNLEKEEMDDLVAFMISLTDTASYSIRKPAALPSFETQKQMNQRVIGGKY